MQVIAVLAYDGMQLFDYAVLSEIWGTDRTSHGVPLFELRTCTPRKRSVRAEAGVVVHATHGLASLRGADLIAVPGSATPLAVRDQAMLEALRKSRAAGTQIVSLCSGTFVLAQAGVLDGHLATTHWMWCNALAERYPRTRVVRDALFVEDDDVWTSAGTVAGIDLCLHLVQRSHGSAVAMAIARRMVSFPHRDGSTRQLRSTTPRTPMGAAGAGTGLGTAMAWVLENLHTPLRVGDLASHARMSERSFARHFTEQVGSSPGQWIQRQRVQCAAALLETSDLPIETVARRVGFSNATALRRHFTRDIGMTPAAYRRGQRRPMASEAGM